MHSLQEAQFQFIREAFVFNHMDGEVFDLLLKKVLREEQSTIV
jgi:hypothetical protein